MCTNGVVVNRYGPVCHVQQPDRNGVEGRNSRHDVANGPTEASEGDKVETKEDGAWPASLRRYLQRAFDKCTDRQGSRQHGQLEKALHRIVTDAMAHNRMLTTDWDNEPLPRCVLASNSNKHPVPTSLVHWF